MTKGHNPSLQAEIYSARYGGFTVRSPQRYLSDRSINSPTPTARIMFRDTRIHSDRTSVDGREWGDVVRSYDLVKITIMGRDGRRHTDINGFVKSVRVMQIELQGEPEHYTEIVVVGFGESVQNYRVFWHPHIATRNNIGGLGYLARSNGRIPKGRPHEVVKGIYDTFLNDDYVFRFSDGETLGQKLSFRGGSSLLSLNRMALSALGLDGSMWDTMKRYADQPWHELFFDVQHERELVNVENQPSESYAQTGFTSTTKASSGRSAFFKNQSELYGRVGIYFRPTPFDFSNWGKLSSSKGWGFRLTEGERIDDGFELERNAARIYNFFFVPGIGLYSGFDQLSRAYEQSGGQTPIYDAESIRRYGYRDLIQGTEYVDFRTTADEATGRLSSSIYSMYDMLTLRTLLLYQWFGYEHFWDGVFSTEGRIGPDPSYGVRIGSVITRESSGWQYYVTGVQQVYNYPGQHTTRITVERGRNPNDYLTWWVSRTEERFRGILSSDIREETLRKFGLWPTSRTIRYPSVTLPSAGGDIGVG